MPVLRYLIFKVARNLNLKLESSDFSAMILTYCPAPFAALIFNMTGDDL